MNSWFTESNGNRIGRMNPDHSGLREFALPNPNSSPRIIALGSDGNMWFVELSGKMEGRAPDGDRQPPTRLGTRLWVAQSAGNKIAFLQFQ